MLTYSERSQRDLSEYGLSFAQSLLVVEIFKVEIGCIGGPLNVGLRYLDERNQNLRVATGFLARREEHNI